MGASVEELRRGVKRLAEAGNAPSSHTVASYERRWRQWEAFASHHGVDVLPADEMHVAAFAVARYRAGVSASGVGANLSAIGWFHGRLDPPVDDVAERARTVLRRLRSDGSDRPLSPAPVVSVGALMAMVSVPVDGIRLRSIQLLRNLVGLRPRQLAALDRGGVEFAIDGSWVELRFPAVGRGRTRPRLDPVTVRLDAGRSVLDCPVEAMRALFVGSEPLVKVGQVYKRDGEGPIPSTGTPLLLAARDRALVGVGYAGALRVEELARARVEDLEPLVGGAYRLRLPTTKSSRDGASQAVVLEPTGDVLDPVVLLDRWLAVRGDADGPLFSNVHHSTAEGGMTADEVRGAIQDLAVAAGLPKTVSGHSLRRSWATHTYLKDRDSVGLISLHLRHSRIDNTVRYIEDLALHLVDPADLLSPDVVLAGPGGQQSPHRDLGFERSPLDELVGAALDAIRGSAAFAPSTLQGYASYWSTWERWATNHGFDVFPADPRAVALFAAARADEGIASSTLRGQLRAMEAVHADNGVPTVGFVRLASEIINGLERDRSTVRRKAPVIPVGDLRAMAAWALNEGSIESERDHLMVCVGYAGGLRMDDLHRARIDNVQAVHAGYVLSMSVSKLNQSGSRREGVLLARRDDELDPVAAIDRWRAISGRCTGPLIPATRPGPDRPLSKDAMGDRLARLAARSGSSVSPTGHSLRRSWATHAYEAGTDLLTISRQLRHRRASMTKGYVDSLTPWRDHPADRMTTVADEP